MIAPGPWVVITWLLRTSPRSLRISALLCLQHVTQHEWRAGLDLAHRIGRRPQHALSATLIGIGVPAGLRGELLGRHEQAGAAAKVVPVPLEIWTAGPLVEELC